MNNSIPRPGVTFGIYPELADKTSHFVSTTQPSQRQTKKWKTKYRLKKTKSIAQQVISIGETLQSFSESDLQQELDDVRYQLMRTGLEEKNIIQSFALIREFAARSIGYRHHNVQIQGAWVMINDGLAEMETGEGKTFTATLVAGTTALAGIPTHVMTANDYLAERDANNMESLYQRLNVSVGIAVSHFDEEKRKHAYDCDITYCTSQQVAFDYMRDRMVLKNQDSRLQKLLSQLPHTNLQPTLFLKGLCFAIVDEADSIFADDAINPLVIAKDNSNPEQEKIYHQANIVASNLKPDIDFILQTNKNTILITEAGELTISEMVKEWTGLWKAKRRSLFLIDLALKARYVLNRDVDYLVKDNKIIIISENSGRQMVDRSWSLGLQQLVECKENCPMSGERETLSSLTYQRFFRRYIKLAAMTGTAKSIRKELKHIYQLEFVSIKPFKSVIRQYAGCRIFFSDEEKWKYCLSKIRSLHEMGRPILIGCRTVAFSNHVSGLLQHENLDHRVLNALQDEDEAQKISLAGELGAITVVTNMAGRGTDIELTAQSKELGGLHVMVVEPNDNRRIDRQLVGRCARQGDPGSYEVVFSLDNEWFRRFYPAWIMRLFCVFAKNKNCFKSSVARNMVTFPQWMIENKMMSSRKALLKREEIIGNLLSFSGRQD